MDKYKEVLSSKEEMIEVKYCNRLLDAKENGLQFCNIDRDDLDTVRMLFTDKFGYYISSKGNYLAWS